MVIIAAFEFHSCQGGLLYWLPCVIQALKVLSNKYQLTNYKF